MKYDGIVIRSERENSLFLFILDPDLNKMRDGIVISEHEVYKNLKSNNLMVVEVDFKDGTAPIDKIDLDEFIYGDSYGTYDTFLHIHDLMLYTISDKHGLLTSMDEIAQKGELNDMAIECINMVKNKLIDQ